MKLASLFIAILFILASCKGKPVPNEIIIEGQVKNMPDGKIYLTEAHFGEIPLDSTLSINGHFKFTIKPDSAFVPYMAAIHFPDSSKPGRLGGFVFRNHMLGPDSMKYGGEAFYLEKGFTWIEGEYHQRQRVFAGKENDLFYSYRMNELGGPGDIGSDRHLPKLAFIKGQIKLYPFSYFLLHGVYENRGQYSKNEIREVLALFNQDVGKSALATQIRTYLTNRIDPGEPYPNLYLLNPASERQHVIVSTAKINMLIFWASWCGPCRMEIPLLKQIQQEYAGKGLNMVSISIDERKENWNTALLQEKMNWPQYIIDNEKLAMVKAQFNCSSIPLVVFTDKTGKEISRIRGYEKEQKGNYEAVIGKFIQ